jgi:hypothetical protein
LPIGESGNIGTFRTQRLYHSFEIIQEERANDWIDRAYKIYCDQWIAQGGEKTRDFIFAVWSNALYHFIMEDILSFLRVAFAMDERATKLFDRTYNNLPQGKEASRRIESVNRIYSNVRKCWAEQRIPIEANALKVFISAPDLNAPTSNFPAVRARTHYTCWFSRARIQVRENEGNLN